MKEEQLQKYIYKLYNYILLAQQFLTYVLVSHSILVTGSAIVDPVFLSESPALLVPSLNQLGIFSTLLQRLYNNIIFLFFNIYIFISLYKCIHLIYVNYLSLYFWILPTKIVGYLYYAGRQFNSLIRPTTLTISFIDTS